MSTRRPRIARVHHSVRWARGSARHAAKGRRGRSARARSSRGWAFVSTRLSCSGCGSTCVAAP